MFQGISYQTMDQKGRIAIPTRFRDVLNSGGNGNIMVTHGISCLMAFSMEFWKMVVEKAASLATFDQRSRDFIRLFIAPAQECIPDKQGRILIPSSLREYGGLEKDIVVAGMLKNFEIWNRKKFDAKMETGRADQSFLLEGAELLGL